MSGTTAVLYKTNHKKTAGNVLKYAVMTVMAVITLLPLVFLFLNSFKSQQEIVSNPLALPAKWSFHYLVSAAEQISYFKAVGITVLITVLAVLLIVLVSSMAAWIMVRNGREKYANIILLMFTSAMLIPFQAVMYPLLSVFETMGLKNMTGLIFMYGGFGLSMSVFMYHGFIKSIPQSLEEAAVIDGANIFQVFFKIVFPLLKSTTVTVVILNAMWIWNDYLLPFLVIGSGNDKTLTLELYFTKIQSGQYGNPWELIFPAVAISIAPIIIIFLSLQKYFVKGVAAGAVKG